jgi:hypothetical protein
MDSYPLVTKRDLESSISGKETSYGDEEIKRGNSKNILVFILSKFDQLLPISFNFNLLHLNELDLTAALFIS